MQKIATTAAAAVVLMLIAAACGSSKSSSGATTGSPAASTTTAAPSGAPAASGTKLAGAVGPGYTITLDQNGQKVASLPAGSYTFVVNDQSSIHGFTLQQTQGGSFQQDLSPIESEGTKTVTVKLTKGQWSYYCPIHQSQMNGSFTVT
jgi:plastocyanin